MATLAFAAPVLPGKTEEWRKFCDELNNQRKAAFSATNQRLGLTGMWPGFTIHRTGTSSPFTWKVSTQKR